MSTTPTRAEGAITPDDESEYNQDDGEATLERRQTTENTTSSSVTYRHSAVQTLPPANAHEFSVIYDRSPVARDILRNIGAAAIGRYGSGLAANPYSTVIYPPFLLNRSHDSETACDDSSFQTCSVAQCKEFLARAKAKASVLVSKQRDAARDVGYTIWVEAKDDMIAHGEQHVIRIQFDVLGNSRNAQVDGLSLPNICGEEIPPESENVRSLATEYTAMPDPPPPPLTEEERDRLQLRRLEAIETASPRTDLDPWALEDYGYIQEASPEETYENWGLGATGTGLEIGGPRFADPFVVYDPAQEISPGPPPVPAWAPASAPTKLKKKARKRKVRTSIYQQDGEQSTVHLNTLDQPQDIAKATPEPSQARGRALSAQSQSRDESERTIAREYSHSHAQAYRETPTERSKSPVDSHRETHYRSRRQAESDAMQAREAEDQHRWEDARAEQRRSQEEAEIERTRQAKNRPRQEVEEKQRMRNAERIEHDQTDTLQHFHNTSQGQIGKSNKNPHTNNHDPSAEDQYALAREAENRRRELAEAQLSSETLLPNSHDRSPRTTRRTDKKAKEKRGLEKKVEDDKVTKTQAKRGPRRELERYDPRKKFGAGR